MDDVRERCNAIEECYEFMLAYAAQGVTGEDGSGKGGQIRHFLERAAQALSGLAAAYSSALGPSEVYRAFLAVLDRYTVADLVAPQGAALALRLGLAPPAAKSVRVRKS